MKRKTQPPTTTAPTPTPDPEHPVDPEILEAAKAALLGTDKFGTDKFGIDKPRRASARCVVCSSETSPNSNEGLCWVCRRLKISAWRDSDTQIPAQE